MKNLLKLASASLLALALTGAVHAIPLTGGVSLSGGYTTDTGNLNTANAFWSFSNVHVNSTSGSFTSLLTGDASVVSMAAFSFDPFPATGVTPLWSTTSGMTLSYDLLGLNSIEQEGDDTLELKGWGIFQSPDFEDTYGTFNFTANQAAGTFSFSFSQATGGRVPDGGTTALLLGLGLIGASFMARRNKVA